MIVEARYALRVALMEDGATERYVIADETDRLHAASSWLLFLHGVPRSPNTIRSYGSKIACYLSWAVSTADWRSVTLSHLVLWRRLVETTPCKKKNGERRVRSSKTVNAWMAPLRSFYEWAEASGLLASDVASQMTHLKYFPPGTPAGGEFGKMRRVLVEQLRSADPPQTTPPEWLDDSEARQKLLGLVLNTRDRFLIDLLYLTGIRVGEALSLFTSDLHFAGGSPEIGCMQADPHLHVRVGNPVENGARAKGCERILFATDRLVDRYIDYVLERNRILGANDQSPHVFVNLYVFNNARGRAMTYSNVNDLVGRISKQIGFDLTGPHMLRHTVATRLMRGIECEPQGMDVVQEIMGHKSITSTRIYAHGQEPAMKAALQALAPRSVALEPDK